MTTNTLDLNKLKINNPPVRGDNPNQDPMPKKTIVPEPKEYHQYRSTRQSIRLITDKGASIIFSGFEFITKNKALIKYLDSQIDIRGLPGISKGALLTSSERNPMETLRRKHFAEFEKMKEEERVALARGIKQDMGKTNLLNEQQLGAVTSSEVASAT